jgi:bifunctional DNA-binding transcriptional regulator/antitoxin component of YhaV-PrlF toxin-antitoxin module
MSNRARANSFHMHALGSGPIRTKYAAQMGVQRYVVSSSGQLSLPAEVRRRWGLVDGGPVDVIDLGFGVLTIPHGEGPALLADLLSQDQHAAFVAALKDPDLATT